MEGMPGMSPPMVGTPTPAAMSGGGGMNMGDMHHSSLMHMTFFWGKDAEILFSGWPGTRTGMYVLALIVAFIMAVLVEWLSHCRIIKEDMNNFGAGLIQTGMHAIRIALAYLVMLALMSFNVGVFLVVVAGHTLGFLVFGSRVFKKSRTAPPASAKTSDLPPLAC